MANRVVSSAHIYKHMKPTVEETIDTSLTRREQVCHTWLRFKVCLFTHKHFFSKTPPASCLLCCRSLTAQHVLIDCPLFSTARAEILKACEVLKIQPVLTNILKGPFPTRVLFEFLKKKIEYLDKI